MADIFTDIGLPRLRGGEPVLNNTVSFAVFVFPAYAGVSRQQRQ